MVCPAILSAEQMVFARLGGAKPGAAVPARNDVRLNAKGRDKEAVDNIFRRHGELDVAPNRNVQLVDFALAVLVLELPHPLFANDEYFHRIPRSLGKIEVDAGAPNKNDHAQYEWKHDPGHFQTNVGDNLPPDFVFGAPAISNGEVNNKREDQDAEKGRNRYQEQVQRVYFGSMRRSGGWKERQEGHRKVSNRDRSPLLASFAVHKEYKQQHAQNGRYSRQPHDSQDHQAVLAGGWIVLIAVQEHLIYRGSDSVLRRLHEPELKVVRGVVNSVKVFGNPSRRGEHHDPAGMGVKVGLRIKRVLEAHGVG